MGGKGDAPPPPDYGPIAAASQASAMYSFELGKQQLDWAKTQWKENKKVSDEVIDFAFGQMDRQAKWAQEDRERYETIFQPLEEQLAKDAEDYASPWRMEQEAGKAEADVAQQFEQARRTAQERLEAYGVDPTQTRAGAMDLQSRMAEAAAQSAAGNQARTQTENIGRALRSEAINVGKGYPGQIAGAAAGAGQSGNQAVNTGLATTASGAQTMGTPTQWQGLGNQATGMWANTLNMGFQNQLDSWKADQSQSSGFGAAAGLIGSFLPKLFDEGGAIPGIEEPGLSVPPEASPSGGAIPDDVDAQVVGGPPAKLNVGEFVLPKDVMKWKGEEWAQKEIMKARAQMQSPDERPAQPSVEVPPPQVAAPDLGAIPMG